MTTTESTHPSLLVRVRDTTDHAAWREFERRYGPLIIRYAVGRGLQLSDAEDVRQTVLLSLSRAMPGFRYAPDRGRFRTYLGAVVRHAVGRHFRRHAGGPAALDGDVLAMLASGDGETDDRWEAEWVRHHCRMALSTLRRTNDGRTLVVFERLLAGRSAVEVAQEFAMTPEAVRKVKQRVRERLEGLVVSQIRDEEASDA